MYETRNWGILLVHETYKDTQIESDVWKGKDENRMISYVGIRVDRKDVTGVMTIATAAASPSASSASEAPPRQVRHAVWSCATDY